MGMIACYQMTDADFIAYTNPEDIEVIVRALEQGKGVLVSIY